MPEQDRAEQELEIERMIKTINNQKEVIVQQQQSYDALLRTAQALERERDTILDVAKKLIIDIGKELFK